ncbi:MAG TPA: hypothetical protein VLB84_12840 [Bacteroidia bacterium]|jgi:hypothetical protein|nr:hypothetical protein [Bacteroidia bacterium]
MKIKKHVLRYVIVLTCALFGSLNGMAAGMGSSGGPCGGIFPPCPIPLDSGEIFLLIAGAAFGAYKIYCSLKKNPA